MRADALCVIGKDREFDLNEDALLAAMDSRQVDKAVISPVDRYYAVHNHEGNHQMLEAARRHPDRLLPACTANPWLGDEAVQEVRRCLQQEACLLVLHPFVQGFLANDELVWPLLAEAQAFHAPVYIHTGPPGNATPWQVTDLAERFPQTDFLMGHCGSTDFWFDVNDAARFAPNIYLETSLARPFSVAGRIQALGRERVVMGSYAPLNDFCFEWDEMAKVLSPDDAPAVLGGNLLALLAKKEAS